jgi:hypothetical protein
VGSTQLSLQLASGKVVVDVSDVAVAVVRDVDVALVDELVADTVVVVSVVAVVEDANRHALGWQQSSYRRQCSSQKQLA